MVAKASSEVTDKTSQHKHIINGMLVFKIKRRKRKPIKSG